MEKQRPFPFPKHSHFRGLSLSSINTVFPLLGRCVRLLKSGTPLLPLTSALQSTSSNHSPPGSKSSRGAERPTPGEGTNWAPPTAQDCLSQNLRIQIRRWQSGISLPVWTFPWDQSELDIQSPCLPLSPFSCVIREGQKMLIHTDCSHSTQSESLSGENQERSQVSGASFDYMWSFPVVQWNVWMRKKIKRLLGKHFSQS